MQEPWDTPWAARAPGGDVNCNAKHASWFNMVEIEIGVLRGQFLKPHIGERTQLLAEGSATWEQQRNHAGARVQWMFTTERARTKLAHAYTNPTKES